MITLPDTDTQGIFAVLRSGLGVKVTRHSKPGTLSNIVLRPEFMPGSRILWSVIVDVNGKRVKRIAGLLEPIQELLR